MLVNSYLKIFTSCYTEFPLCSGQEVLREVAVNDEEDGDEKDEDKDGEGKDEGGEDKDEDGESNGEDGEDKDEGGL